MYHWHIRAVPIKFQISDWTLFSVPLKVQERANRPTDEFLAPGLPELPPVPLSDGTQAYLFRSVPIATDLPRIGFVGEFLRYVPLQYQHSYIDMRTSFECYQKRFSAKSRSTIARKVRRYADHCGGTIPWRTYKTRAEIREFFQLARSISKRTYQEKLSDSGIPGTEEFIYNAEQRAENEQVRAYVLFDGAHPVSFMYCPVYEGVVCYGYLGFDPDYYHWSVGTVLLWLVIEQLFAEGQFTHFDFTEGQSEQKRRFATHERRCANVFLVKRTARNTALILSHLAMEQCSRWLGVTLDRIGAKQKVKRLLRPGLPHSRSGLERASSHPLPAALEHHEH